MEIKTHLKLIAVETANEMRIQELQYKSNKKNNSKKMRKKKRLFKISNRKIE